MDKKSNIILHLSLAEGVGSATLNKLIKVLKQEEHPESWYTHKASYFLRLGMSSRVAQKIVSGLADSMLIDQEHVLIQKHNVQWATILDDTYPELLRHIHVPPPVLYWKGELPRDDMHALAFVGARKGNAYGERAVNMLVPDLVARNWAIVSGGAYGIDTMAHTATLQAGGRTVVVLGSGLLSSYPAENRTLFKDIVLNGGAVVSSFPLRERPDTWTFPIRNRIIAGLSHGCVVVQAAKRSGALITATHSLQEGRHVFALPGPFDDALSQGCHILLQEGAKLVYRTQDILEEFGIQETEQEQEVAESKKKEQQLSIEPDHPVLMYCSSSISLSDLSKKTGIQENELESQLFDLQLEGKVQQDFAGLWKCL